MVSTVSPSKHQYPVAFFSTEAPQNLCSPLQVRAPEALSNHLSTLRKIEFGPQTNVWSMDR